VEEAHSPISSLRSLGGCVAEVQLEPLPVVHHEVEQQERVHNLADLSTELVLSRVETSSKR